MTADTSITGNFPISELSPIATDISPPSYLSLKTAQKELNACARAVQSDEGGGRHGHLCLTVDAATYLAVTGVAFNIPVAPPPAPVIPQLAPTGQQINEAVRQHAADKLVFARYHDTDKALLKLLIAAVPPVYIEVLCDEDYGFATVTTLDMLTHLKTAYGRISIAEREANQTRMMTPWHPPLSIEKLFSQLQRGIRFAIAAGEPIGDLQVARMGYTNLLNTGLFTEACRDWRLKLPANQTFAELQSHFRRMDFDRIEALTSATAGYQAPDPAPPAAHAANAAVTDPSTELLNTLISEIRLMRQSNSNTNQPRKETPAATSYCWTHGTSRNVAHTSSTCRAKAEGHVDNATSTNKQGGSDKVWSSANSRTRSSS